MSSPSPCRKRCALTRSRIRSPTAAAPSLPVSGRISANSSPPKRDDHVGLARALANQSGGLDQRPAAVEMAVRVVDRLEPVQVDEQQRQRPAAARGALGFPAQHLRQVARVVELRQVVGDRQRLGPRDSQGVIERDGPRLQGPTAAPPGSRGANRGSRDRGRRSSPTSAPTVLPRHSSGNADGRGGAVAAEPVDPPQRPRPRTPRRASGPTARPRPPPARARP